MSSRDESFLDLSVDVEQNASVTGCLRNFSSSEILGHKDKFYCEKCASLQEAEKRCVARTLGWGTRWHARLVEGKGRLAPGKLAPADPRGWEEWVAHACVHRMRIKRLPYVLALHLKRFKFVDTQYKKLSYRVNFPMELRLFNSVRLHAGAWARRGGVTVAGI